MGCLRVTPLDPKRRNAHGFQVIRQEFFLRSHVQQKPARQYLYERGLLPRMRWTSEWGAGLASASLCVVGRYVLIVVAAYPASSRAPNLCSLMVGSVTGARPRNFSARDHGTSWIGERSIATVMREIMTAERDQFLLYDTGA